MNKTKKIFLLAVEPSGDRLAADLAMAMQSSSDYEMEGIGGPSLAAAGIKSDFDISPLAILGFTEALRAYPVVRKKVREAIDLIMSRRPDAVVLIDSWGFMIRVAAGLKKRGYDGPIIKYVAPQVWAMREGRAKTLARHVDHLLSIHSFDAPYFEKQGLPVTFVGNPMFDDQFDPQHQSDFRARKNLNDRQIVTVLFGSRPSEIERLYEPFAECVALMAKTYPEIALFSPVSSNVREQLKTKIQDDNRIRDLNLLDEGEKYDLFSESRAALACSGTVTTQLAIMGVPAVVAYKLSAVTFLIGKMLFKPDYISLINISADRALFPEFVQKQVAGETLFKALRPFIEDNQLHSERRNTLMKQAQIMKGKGGSASMRAAQAIQMIMSET